LQESAAVMSECADVAAADSEICYTNWSVANSASGVTEIFSFSLCRPGLMIMKQNVKVQYRKTNVDVSVSFILLLTYFNLMAG
jgi:hypothetical protein